MSKGTKRTLTIALAALVILSQLLAGCSGMIQLTGGGENTGDGSFGLDLGLNPDQGDETTNSGENQTVDVSPLILWVLTGMLLGVAALSAIALGMSQSGRSRPQ